MPVSTKTKIYIPVALLAGMVIACGSGGTTEHDAIEARIICQNFIKDRLKSPGSAEFSEEAETGTYPTFTSTGKVDSQNSFGALIRNEYACTVTYHPSTDKWTLEDLSGLDN